MLLVRLVMNKDEIIKVELTAKFGDAELSPLCWILSVG